MTAASPGAFPRLLHQTWKTRDLSAIEEFRLCAASWRAHHPDHAYRLWDDRDNAAFVAEHFPDYLDTWRSFDVNIKRLDSIRYMWMYVYGGIYADLDMECLQSLEGLMEAHREHDALLFCDLDVCDLDLSDLDARAHCISANPALLISRPGSPFWLEALAHARRHADRYVTECTGPFALGAVANAHAARLRVALLDQNRLFIRKTDRDFYTKVPGNASDPRVYRKVTCATRKKPAKYFADRKRKYVADWHGTPRRYRWKNEYRTPRG